MEELRVQNQNLLSEKEAELADASAEATELRLKLEDNTGETPVFSSRSDRRKSKEKTDEDKLKRGSSAGRNSSGI